MLCYLRSRVLSRATNGAASLSPRHQPSSSTIPSAIIRSDHMMHSFPRSRSDLEDTTSRSKSIAGKEKFSSTVSSDSVSVHPAAIVHQEAIICKDVVIGPFCTVGSSVKLGRGCVLHPNSHVLGRSELGEGCVLHTGAVVGDDAPGCTILGKENSIGHYAVVGVKCQDLKYKGGEDCHLNIGNKNDIREYVSIHRSSKSSDQTTVGNGNLIMGACHIAHDCKLGNGNILANGTLLGGHVILQDHVHTGGGVAVHQRCQIDSYAFVAGGSMVVNLLLCIFARCRGPDLVNGRNLIWFHLPVHGTWPMHSILFIVERLHICAF
eukprot:c14158_g1_i4 orf=1000-1962(-)